MLECWGEEWKVSKTKLEDQAPVGCKEDTPMKETFQGSDHHESLVIEATSQRRSSQGEPRDNHNPKRRLNPLLGCRPQGGELGRSPLLLLSSTRMISLSRCGGVGRREQGGLARRQAGMHKNTGVGLGHEKGGSRGERA